MRNHRFGALLLFAAFVFAGCNSTNKNEVVKTDSLPAKAEIRLHFGTMQPSPPYWYFKYERGKTDTLYVSSYDSTVFRQPITQSISDSIFLKTESVLNNFPWKDEGPTINDGISIRLSISVNHSVHSGYWGSLTSLRDLPAEVQELIRLINRQVPTEHQLK